MPARKSGHKGTARGKTSALPDAWRFPPYGFRFHHRMFANLVQLITGRPPAPDLERNLFVEEVRVIRDEPRSRRVEWTILGCWILIAVKHVFIIWACRHYPVPFHQLWVNFPTWLLGVLATVVYFARVSRRPLHKPSERPGAGNP
jgi:hypothetical protein